MSDNAKQLAQLQQQYEELVRLSGRRDPEVDSLLAAAKRSVRQETAWAVYVEALRRVVDDLRNANASCTRVH
jgi:hypothetical protein